MAESGFSRRKGISQTLFLVVAAAVLLVVALGVLFVFQTGFGEFGEWAVNMTEGDYEDHAEQVRP